SATAPAAGAPAASATAAPAATAAATAGQPGVELGDEHVGIAGVGDLDGAGADREEAVGRARAAVAVGLADDVDEPLRVEGHAIDLVVLEAAEVGGEAQAGAQRVEQRHEAVLGVQGRQRRLHRVDVGEGDRGGNAGDGGVAAAVEGDREGAVVGAGAQVRAVD